jgi:hypothetical protein
MVSTESLEVHLQRGFLGLSWLSRTARRHNCHDSALRLLIVLIPLSSASECHSPLRLGGGRLGVV